MLQRLDEKFDLIIATNMFVYYGEFEQCLALANVGAVLRPGGFLLSNNALLELPVSVVHSLGYSIARRRKWASKSKNFERAGL